MKKTFLQVGLSLSLLCAVGVANAQTTDTAGEFKPHGKLWGYGFGDYAYKGGTDDLTANRGGSNQYTKVALNTSMFQWRRIYLGYNYEISRKFVAELLLAAEDDWGGGTVPGTGDVLGNNKFSPYVKLMNLRWKQIFKGTDFVGGQLPTPAFAQGSALKEYAPNTMTSEEVWGYRSIERTITDIRRTPSFDMGFALQGSYADGNCGYDLMVGNGQSAKPENDNYKWFYGDIWAKFMNKKLIVDLYQDYEKLHWGVYNKVNDGVWNNDRNMTKLFVAYQIPKFTVGFEGFMMTLLGDVAITGKNGINTYRNTNAMGVSLFVKGRITKETLGFFARMDNYDPTGNLKSIVDYANTKTYAPTTSQYDPTTKEMFTTLGIDYTPIKNVHIMPNIWMNTYQCGVDATGANAAGTKYSSMNSGITKTNGTDLVYRVTGYFVFGK